MLQSEIRCLSKVIHESSRSGDEDIDFARPAEQGSLRFRNELSLLMTKPMSSSDTPNLKHAP